MEGVRAAMKTRHLEADKWLNRKEWSLGSGSCHKTGKIDKLKKDMSHDEF
jgi:hypothetical protein